MVSFSSAPPSTAPSSVGGGGASSVAAAGAPPRDRSLDVSVARAARAAARKGAPPPSAVSAFDDDGGGGGGCGGAPPPEFDGDVPLDAFTMEGDEEEGHFDPETGTFVFAAREEAFARRAARRGGLRATEDEEEGEAEGLAAGGGEEGGEGDDSGEEGGAGGGGGDAWLAELTSMAPSARRALQERARTQQAAREAAEAARGGGGGGGGDPLPLRRALALHALAQRLQEGEDVSGALRRLSGGGGGGGGGWQRKRGGGGGGGAAATGVGRDMAAFDVVTEAADALLRDGLAGVYSLNKRRATMEVSEALADAGMARSAFEALLAARGLAAAPAPPPPPPQQQQQQLQQQRLPPGREFVFRWANDAAGVLHGPFSSAEMDAWAAAGYFAAQPVEVARKGETGLDGSSPVLAWGPLAAQY